MSTTEQQRILRDFLERYDADGDEEVTKDEFEIVMKNEGVDTVTIEAVYRQAFANWDSDKNSRLSKREIKTMADKWASFPGDQSK